MIDRIENAVTEAFRKLKECDGDLFECPIEEHAEYDSRKLHEVCINHKLAIYLEEYLFPEIENENETFFTDIEFNREGVDFKNLQYDGEDRIVRPDIIIHNRKSGAKKNNFLVVECKKNSASDDKKELDVRKIEAFLTDQRYEYRFGLQTVYSREKIKGKLFFVESDKIKFRDIQE